MCAVVGRVRVGESVSDSLMLRARVMVRGLSDEGIKFSERGFEKVVLMLVNNY